MNRFKIITACLLLSACTYETLQEKYPGEWAEMYGNAVIAFDGTQEAADRRYAVIETIQGKPTITGWIMER